MGIFDRFTTIMKSNVNAALDKVEDPSKVVDQTLRDLREDLADVKRNTAAVMAEEKRVKQQLDDCDGKIKLYEDRAVKALQSGNESDAKTLISAKQAEESKREGLQNAYNVAHANADKMRQMHDKLVSDIQVMESKKETIKATVSVAKAQESMARASKSASSASSMEAFDRMEAKANKMLNQSSSMLELEQSATEESADAIAAKYGSGGSSSVDSELEALKASLGL